MQDKVANYRRAKLNKRETLFRDLCFLALDFMANGCGEKAIPILQFVGWEMTEAARGRFAKILGDEARLYCENLQPNFAPLESAVVSD